MALSRLAEHHMRHDQLWEAHKVLAICYRVDCSSRQHVTALQFHDLASHSNLLFQMAKIERLLFNGRHREQADRSALDESALPGPMDAVRRLVSGALYALGNFCPCYHF